MIIYWISFLNIYSHIDFIFNILFQDVHECCVLRNHVFMCDLFICVNLKFSHILTKIIIFFVLNLQKKKSMYNTHVFAPH